jgi:putative ABC transport system ATP-binding protein
MKENLVDIRNIRFSWNPGEELIHMDGFSIERGERVLLRGESGCGKTTLLNLITGIRRVDSGYLAVDGVELSSLKAHARDRFRAKNIGYIFQQFNLIPYLNARDNILSSIVFSPESEAKKNSEERLDFFAKELGLEDLMRKKAHELSIGQQQRVALARALLSKPQLLIADEPTSALDTTTREKFMRLLIDESEQQGTTLLAVSHDNAIGGYFERVVDFEELNGGAS